MDPKPSGYSPNLATGILNADNNASQTTIPVDTGTVCPIAGVGQDAETPALVLRPFSKATSA